MSKLTVTDFSKRTGSPFQSKSKDNPVVAMEFNEDKETTNKPNTDKEKKKRDELLEKINKKTAEIQLNKPKDGVFIEVVTHGAFTAPKSNLAIDNGNGKSLKVEGKQTPTKNYNNGSKSLLGYPSSANDLALEAKSDLESDPNISKEVKGKVIEKLFVLVSMVQHLYESKVRVAADFEKYKEKSLRDEIRMQKEHTEQLYKLNVNFQNEFVQAVQQIKSELDLSRQFNRSFEAEERVPDQIEGSKIHSDQVADSVESDEVVEKT